MPARLCKSFALLVILSLLLAACQPIQPVQPEDTTATPGWIERTFPVPGVTVSLPAEWIFRYEPMVPALMTWSAEPPDEPQKSNGMWPYLMEEPIAQVNFINLPYDAELHADLAATLASSFTSYEASLGAINPDSNTTVVEEPSLLTINGQPAAKMVVEGTDIVLQKPFRTYVYAIHSGDQILLVSSALVEANEAVFVPLVEQIVQSVAVGAPQPLPPPLPEVTGEIAPGETVAGILRLSPPDQVVRDYWHFTAEAGKGYVASALIDDKYGDAVLDVVDAAGTSVVGAEVDNTGGGEAETVEFRAEEAGDYYVAVRTFFLDPGGYTLELQETE